MSNYTHKRARIKIIILRLKEAKELTFIIILSTIISWKGQTLLYPHINFIYKVPNIHKLTNVKVFLCTVIALILRRILATLLR